MVPSVVPSVVFGHPFRGTSRWAPSVALSGGTSSDVGASRNSPPTHSILAFWTPERRAFSIGVPPEMGHSFGEWARVNLVLTRGEFFETPRSGQGTCPGLPVPERHAEAIFAPPTEIPKIPMPYGVTGTPQEASLSIRGSSGWASPTRAGKNDF